MKSTNICRHILAMALLALTIPVTSTAWAQDGTDPAAAAVDPTIEGDPTAEELEEEGGIDVDPDDPLYWAKLRDIYTFQRRDVLKQGKISVTAYTGLIPNNIFEQYVPFGLRIDYFILENIGIELASSYNLTIDTGLRETIQSPDGVGAEQVLIGDTQISHTNFGVVWSPFYGKTSWYDSALKYFDIYLFGGAGIVVAQTVPDFNADPETEIKPEGAIGAGMAFYLGQSAHLRLDFRQFIFQKVSGGVANPSEVSLGFGWLLGTVGPTQTTSRLMNDMFEKTMKMAKQSRLGAIAILLALLVSTPAMAQEPAAEATAEAETTEEVTDDTADETAVEEEATEDEGAETTEATDEAASDEPASATNNEVVLPEGQDPLGNELQRYWSSDRDLATIEDKLFRKDGRISAGLHVGLMSSEPFWWYLPVGGKVSYNFSDQIGVEVGGQYLIGNKTDLHTFLEGRGVETFDSSTDLEDKMVWRANATFIWSPLYGKWAFLNNKLTHFDFNLAVGAGVVGVDRPNAARDAASSAIEPELVFGPGAHFFLSENWLLRADGRFYVYRGAESDTETGFFERLQMPIEFLVGGSYLF